MKKNEMLAARASAASTDDIRRGRATEAFNDQLAAELREARLAAAARRGGQKTKTPPEPVLSDFTKREEDNKTPPQPILSDFTKRETDRGQKTKTPPQPELSDFTKREKDKSQKAAKVTLPRNNPARNTPSNQPTGAQVSGPHAAVMPNTTYIPPKPDADSKQHKG